MIYYSLVIGNPTEQVSINFGYLSTCFPITYIPNELKNYLMALQVHPEWTYLFDIKHKL